jgi:hypothetical protein
MHPNVEKGPDVEDLLNRSQRDNFDKDLPHDISQKHDPENIHKLLDRVVSVERIKPEGNHLESRGHHIARNGLFDQDQN